jgi:hypothetical protein
MDDQHEAIQRLAAAQRDNAALKDQLAARDGVIDDELRERLATVVRNAVQLPQVAAAEAATLQAQQMGRPTASDGGRGWLSQPLTEGHDGDVPSRELWERFRKTERCVDNSLQKHIEELKWREESLREQLAVERKVTAVMQKRASKPAVPGNFKCCLSTLRYGITILLVLQAVMQFAMSTYFGSAKASSS